VPLAERADEVENLALSLRQLFHPVALLVWMSLGTSDEPQQMIVNTR
jgi:hypothetical protein